MTDQKELAAARAAALFAIDQSSTVEDVFSDVGCRMNDVHNFAMFASRKTAEVLREQLPRRQAAHRHVLFELVESEGRNAWLDGCVLGLYFAGPAEEGDVVGVDALMAARVTLVAQRLEDEDPEAAALRYVGLDPKPVEHESMRRAAEVALLFTDRLAPEYFPECVAIFSGLWIDGLTVAIQARRDSQGR